MDFGKILARGLLQFGAGGPNLRASGGAIEVRNPANNGYAGLIAATLTAANNLEGATLLLVNQGGAGSKRLTVSTTPPSSPADGDLFLEINSSNFLPYGWIWSWNGSYWLSPQTREKMHAIGANTGDHNYYLHLEQSLDTFIEAFETTSLIAGTNNSTNYWSFVLSRTSANNTLSTITTVTTASNTASNWVTNRANLSQHLDISALGSKILQVSALKTNAAGSCYLTPEITYRYARP
jgi:hypothetical protein